MVLCLFISSFSAQAAVQPFCQETKYVLVFGNGVWTKFIDAYNDKKKLEQVIKAQLPPDRRAVFRSDLAYDNTQGKLEDLLEATRQAINSDYHLFWRILAGLIPMPQAILDAVKAQGPLITPCVVPAADLANHIAMYKREILEGNIVTVVVHSQGNFFVNEAFAQLTPDEHTSLGVVGVADPDFFVAGGGPYTTSGNDLVILAITAVESAAGSAFLPPPPNTIALPSLTDLSGHFFTASYMKDDSASRAKIIQDTLNTFNRLTPRSNPAKQGAIVATLTCGAEPDVDLHAFQPRGSHVYYASKQGASGSLDVDDVTGFGPEHYTVPCGTLQTGTYTIGVNYFNGTGPELAHVQVSAGQNSNRGFDIPPAVADGAAGDPSPIPVTTVNVQGDSTAGFQFSIGDKTPQAQNP